MDGAIWVLLVALMLYATSLLMHRAIDGHWAPARLPVTWFYGSWLIGLTLLALPLFKYYEAFSAETAAYLLLMLFVFSAGAAAAAFWAARVRGRRQRQAAAQALASEGEVSQRLLLALLAMGIVGTGLLLLNTVLGGSLSLADRLDSDNFAAVRLEHMLEVESHIGLLFGPAGLMSAIGSLGVAFVFYLRGSRAIAVGESKWIYVLAWLVLAFNLATGFIGFGSRMFAVFGFLVAFFAFAEGRWAIGERLIAKRLKPKEFVVIALATITTLAALWVSATVFLEFRVQRQDPLRLMFKTHRASLDPLAYDLVRNDKTSQYLLLSLSYLSTPIPTLAFYLDLPQARQPGPFYGEYDFPAIWRWGRRLTFSADPYSWPKARYEIFKPLGDIGFGMNVWSTLVRDLIADFGKAGALVFVAGLGFLSQRVFDLQRQSPSARRAGLLVYLRLLLAFAGLISILFMSQIHWPLYLAIALVAVSGSKRRTKPLAASLSRNAAAFHSS